MSLVIVGHYWEWLLPGGFIGVDIFFVLSGYLITTLLLQEHAGTGRVSLGHFYARRALRLLPALGFLLAVVAVWALVAAPSALRSDTISGYPSVIFYYSNWYWGYLGNNIGVLGHLWSLSLEEQFYLAWPLVLIGFLALRRGIKALLLGCLALIVIATLLRWELAQRNFTDEGLRRLTKLRGDILLIGCALALATAKGRMVRIPHQVAVAASWVGVAGLVFFGALLRDGVHEPLFFKGGYTLVGIAAGLLVYRVVFESDGLLVRVLSLKPMVAIGRLSYALYLWHSPMRDIVKPELDFMASPLRPVVVLMLTLAVSALSFRIVERPALRLKSRFGPTAPREASGPASAGVPGSPPFVAIAPDQQG